MKKGIFITFEGLDGSGKTTQIERLHTFLKASGYDPLVTREPGGTKIGERIRDLILDNENAEMSPVTEMLLYAASRAQHVDEVIRPALRAGRIVISDRFTDSSIVYQGGGRGLGDVVEKVNDFATKDCCPQITFLLKTDPYNSFARIDARSDKPDRIESEGASYQAAVFASYLELEKRYPKRIIGIDASGTIEAIHNEIKSRLMPLLDAEKRER